MKTRHLLLLLALNISPFLFRAQVCTPAMTAGTGTVGISNVQFNTINRTSAVAEGYTNTALTTSVTQGGTYTLSVTFIGINAPGVWIDYNNNGILTDAGEIIVSTTGTWYPSINTTKTATVLIPAGTPIGWKRMRVYAKQGTGPVSSPCNTSDPAGDIEDFDIYVMAASSTSFTPTFTNAPSSCSGNSISVTANTGTFSASGYTWTAAPASAVIASPNASSTAITFPSAMNYTITLTSTSGTSTAAYSSSVAVYATPTIVVNSPTICSGTSTVLTASGAMSYSWSTGAATSSISVSPTITTNYTVTGTGLGSCASTETTQVNVVVCTGINEAFQDNFNFTVYPIPAQKFLRLKSSNNVEVTFEVTDVTGNIISSGKGNIEDVQIDVSHYSDGIYFIRLNSGGRNNFVKFVKN